MILWFYEVAMTSGLPASDRTNDISNYRLDVLFGVKTLDGRLATRVSGVTNCRRTRVPDGSSPAPFFWSDLPKAQAIFCRRRHQASRPPLANSRPGSPAPTMGPGAWASGTEGVKPGPLATRTMFQA